MSDVIDEPVARKLIPSTEVLLPVGVEKGGSRFKRVVIDEMTGLDEHLASSKRVGDNGAKGLTAVLTRCVQEIDGVVPKKKRPDDTLDPEIFRRMTQVDRDFLTCSIYLLGGKEELVMAGECPRCGKAWQDAVKISELEVYDWPEDKPLRLDFQLEVGVPEFDKEKNETIWHKEGVIRFPIGRDLERASDLDSTPAIMDALIAACIVKVGTLDHVDSETAKRLRSRDRAALFETIQYELPGLRQWMAVKCKCGREFDVRADMSSFFGGRRKHMIGGKTE